MLMPSVRSGVHAEHEVGIFEMIDDALISFGSSVMNFVNQNVVEFIGFELRQTLRLPHRLYRGEYVAAVLLLAGA